MATAGRQADWRGKTANAHQTAGKVAPDAPADGEGSVAGDEDDQQSAHVKHDEHGPEEGEEQFSPCNTSICG